MKIVPMYQVTPDMVLAKPILIRNGVTLLPSGTKLTESKMLMLEKYNVDTICIFEDENAKDIMSSQNNFFDIYRKKLADKMVISSPEEIYAMATKLVQQIKDTPEISWDLLETRLREDSIYRHSIVVAILSVSYAIKVRMDETKIRNLCAAALLHDIGKRETPVEILFKKGPLTPDERTIMEKHSIEGYNMVKNVYAIPATVKTSILSHHENYDGTGYPNHLKGNQIYEFARIIRIADTIDALLEKRVYKEAMYLVDVMKYIKENSGTLFDPEMVKVFLEIMVF